MQYVSKDVRKWFKLYNYIVLMYNFKFKISFNNMLDDVPRKR